MAVTNAVRLLKAAGVSFETREYEVDESDLSGVHIAESLGIDKDTMFKTLVTVAENRHYVFCIPSGAELDFTVFADVTIVAIGIIYILSRCVGKYFGAQISARATKCDESIVKYLGITLFPQAGVALGMAMKAAEFGPEGVVVANITLFAVLVYEVIGPVLTKNALTAAGDITEKPADSSRRKKNVEAAK